MKFYPLAQIFFVGSYCSVFNKYTDLARGAFKPGQNLSEETHDLHPLIDRRKGQGILELEFRIEETNLKLKERRIT